MGKNGNNMEDCGNLKTPVGNAGSFTCPPLQPMPFHTLNRVGNPKRLELGDNSTPIPTFSHIQLDPIQEQYSLEGVDNQGHGSDLRNFVVESQNQFRAEMERFIGDKIDKNIKEGFAELMRQVERKTSLSGGSETSIRSQGLPAGGHFGSRQPGNQPTIL